MNGSVEITTLDLTGVIDRDFLNGLSAYLIAVKHGYTGTEEEWIKLLLKNSYKVDTDGNLVVTWSE